jgi:hypothetical protein
MNGAKCPSLGDTQPRVLRADFDCLPFEGTDASHFRGHYQPRQNLSSFEQCADFHYAYDVQMIDLIKILFADVDDAEGVIVKFSDGTTAGYVIEELLELRPHRQPLKPEPSN